RLWNKADQYDPARGLFAAWFMTIVRNHLKDTLKNNSQHQQLRAAEEINQLIEEIPDSVHDIEEQTWLLHQGDVLLRALQKLPEEQRSVLILAYFSGLSQSAIAQQLNLPLGTVKKRIRLGLQKLRVMMAGQDIALDIEVESEQAETGTSDRHEM